MRDKVVMLIFAATLAPSTAVWALDAQSAKTYCDEVKRAAQQAQAQYIQVHQPRTDPGTTFEKATSACLDFIASFQVNPLGLADGALNKAAKQLLQRTCQAAHDQFGKAISDAVQSVDSAAAQVPNASVRTRMQSNRIDSEASTAPPTEGKSTKQSPLDTAIDRVINLLK